MKKNIFSVKNVLRALAIVGVLGLLVFGAFKVIAYGIVASTPLISIDEIQQMADQEDYEGAIKSCKRRLLADANEYSTLTLLGSLYEENSEPRNAEAVYRKLLKDNEDDPTLHFYLGRSLFHKNEIEAAVKSLNASIALAEKSFPAEEVKEILSMNYGLLGEIYVEHTKEYRKAIAELQKFLNLDPANPEARYQLATAYAYSSQYQNAFKEFDKIIKENPNTEIAKLAENAIQYVREKRNPGKSKVLLD